MSEEKMGFSEHAARVKQDVLPLLDEDLGNGVLTKKIEAFKKKEKIEAYAMLFLLLAHLHFEEKDAEEHWRAVIEHRIRMTDALKRDVGIRVAIMDYFVNLNKKLTHPKVIELSIFEKIELSAVTDSLTGLYNNRHFKDILQKELDRAERFHQREALLFFDIDDFKEVNDTYGHLHGDMVLGEIANIIKKNIRSIDLASRWGGDEFAVLLPETHRYGAYTVGERIRNDVMKRFADEHEKGGPITFSGGVACYPEDTMDSRTLINHADTALYRAKSNGKNQLCLYYAERRHFMRFHLSDSLLVKEISEKNGVTSTASINISRGGLLFESRKPFPIGTTLEITFRSQKGETSTFRACAVRLEDTGVTSEGPVYDVGCAFVIENQEDEKRIMDYLLKYFPERL